MWNKLRLLLIGFVVAASCAWTMHEDGKTRVIVHAKATEKLSAELNAVRISNGTLIGLVPRGGVAVEVSGASFTAVEETLKSAGATRVEGKVPAQIVPVKGLLLSYKKGSEPSSDAIQSAGFKVAARHEYDGGGVLLIQPTGHITAQAVTAVSQIPGVTHLEADQVVSIPPMPKKAENRTGEPGESKKEARASGTTIPDDPLFAKLWGMNNIHAPYAWNKVKETTVIVADIDTGADPTHEDLAENVVQGFNFIDNSTNTTDDNGHGTHTAGTIGAVGNNGKGVVGVCWRVRIMPLKFLDSSGSGSLFNAVKCVDFATQHEVRVMSNSWGSFGFSQALSDAITRANTAGILFVAAAGNYNNDNDTNPYYPASYKIANVISVAAIDVNDKKASFSDFGATSVHIGAPGLDIWSTVPKSGPLGDPSGYASLSGTSMATPHVSGSAALLLGHPAHEGDKCLS